ncbi:hypothetical protein TRFO_02248 [Tritrichomonas foetus]|uniref:Uncharacterized protein n=1 Tax=Tritrichomonas foetus TaxID=1144522 RepID=A0A1J4JCX3_9EUKA|nr:hypothetical protein TRFO_02248 [Tritrichomonas foetus]|eukprot:OHS95261.1 hypothetical protein TRFO_02248 [Tritrichomonas foetus]
MTDTTQHSRIANYIADIINCCANDQSLLEVAVANFQHLNNAMKGYERAPKYFNGIIEDAEISPTNYPLSHFPTPYNAMENNKKFPIANELEKIYDRKLKQCELQMLAKELSSKIGLKLSRDTKRNKTDLLNWFAHNWVVIHPKIFEYQLEKFNFEKTPKQ